MNFIILIIAGLLEIGFASCLGKARETTGSTSALWYTGFFIALSVSMMLLMKATKTIPMGTAYAVWTGIGAAGTMLMGIFIFKEPATFWRMFFLITLIASVFGLKYVSH
jgi:quaternary ammonium compound-resistance protein SugE